MTDTGYTPTPAATTATGWMSDVQRAIALILIGAFAFVVVVATVRFVFSADAAVLNDMAKTLQAALVNMVLIALGFFFGSNLSKTLADAGQQKIVDKLTSGSIPTAAPTGNASVPWWTKLTAEEKTAITASGTGDPRVAAFIIASTAGAANADDLNYLVSKSLITQERATIIAA